MDVVIRKAPGVLGHAELFEPVLNPLHRRPPSRIYRGLAELLDYPTTPSILRPWTKQANLLSLRSIADG